MTLIVDAFEGTFTNTLLAQQIEHVPFRPNQVGLLLAGPIVAEFPETNAIQVDVVEGRIGVLGTQPVGADPQVIGPRPLASSFPLGAKHIPARSAIYASEVSGKRQPGETELKSLVRVVNDRLSDPSMR